MNESRPCLAQRTCTCPADREPGTYDRNCTGCRVVAGRLETRMRRMSLYWNARYVKVVRA